MPAHAPDWDLITGAPLPASAPTELHLLSSCDFQALFQSAAVQRFLGTDTTDTTDTDIEELRLTHDYPTYLHSRLLTCPLPPLTLLAIGISALHSFLQCNMTGPPLPFTSTLLLPPALRAAVKELEKNAVASLTVDGEAAYHLTPNALLLVVARAVLNSDVLREAQGVVETLPWWRLRVNFLHQRVLAEAAVAQGLHALVYEDLSRVDQMTRGSAGWRERFLVERALVETYYGHDAAALKGLEEAARETGLRYALTGVLGRRTKWQQGDTSQLVVVAVSAGEEEEEEGGGDGEQNGGEKKKKEEEEDHQAPQGLKLDDDTLLEAIAFTPQSTSVLAESSLPPDLAALDPADQPKLRPLDAAILLLVAETIKNTNPAEGLTREEMMPYAERVLKHPTNWAVYTHGLLVRSKLEGYRSRTTERGLLQLQAVVDQVIADTSGVSNSTDATTFLPRPTAAESAPASARLRYIHQLPAPPRWSLEASLAARWISLGGLRSALDIYARLEMHAELALCHAATNSTSKAHDILTARLALVPPPSDAPRLWCILGDIDEDPAHYQAAWEASNHRYARAQRSLARLHLAASRHAEAAAAYQAALSVNALHHASWFALGCCHLTLEDWAAAITAFTRAVSLDDADGESWSNLASALLRAGNQAGALAALKRAAATNRDEWRIWENLATVAAACGGWTDVLVAVRRVVELRGEKSGDGCIDAAALEAVLAAAVAGEDEPGAPGLNRMLVELVSDVVAPLITGSARLWRLVVRVETWRRRWREALAAQEKAWRVVSVRAGIEERGVWEELVDATVEMVGAYEAFGGRVREGGMGDGEVVMKEWRWKARSCVRGVMGRGRECWEGTEGWERLEVVLEGLKG